MNYHHKFKKQYGQNFLRSSRSAQKIIAPLNIQGNDLIIEIGPGEGIVTSQLLDKGARVLAIEIDYDLVVKLIKRFRDNPNFTVVHQNFLDVNLDEVLAKFKNNGEVKVTGSIPYNVSKKIIDKIVRHNYDFPESKSKIVKVSFLVQEEVSKAYNARPPRTTFLSNYVRLFADVRKSESIAASQFYPVPKVDGGILVLAPYQEFSDKVNDLKSLLKIAFSSQRKTLAKNLKSSNKWKNENVDEALKKLNLKDKIRPSELDFENWEGLLQELGPRK